jgi:hypothetical protein
MRGASAIWSRWPGCAAIPTSPPHSSARGPPQQIDGAAGSLDIEPTDEEIRALKAPYTPRHDFQGISDDADLQAIMARLPQFTTAA